MIKPALRYLSLLAWLLLAGGCAHTTHSASETSQPQAWLEPGVQVTLPPPGIAQPVQQQQLLTGTVKGRQQSLLVLLNADKQQLSLAGLSSLGIRLFLLTYDQQGIHTEQYIQLPQLPPASQVLADIMLSHWPLSAWQSRLPAGWTLQDHDDRRELRDPQGKLITDIRYRQHGQQREPVSLTQHAFDYQITIQSLGD